MNDEVKKVAIWSRVSTDMQVEGDSPETHIKRAEMYAESRGWEVVEIYRLDAVSGKAVIKHPTSQQMLQDVEKGKVSGLIFSKLARLARNTRELLDFSDHFQKYNADLISLQESIDTSSPAGRLFYTLIGGMAQWEREEISERVAASVPIRAKMGKSLGGAAPYGYRWVDKQLEIEPTEAPIRKLMFELFLKLKRKGAVARVLNEKGYRTRKGAKFTDTTVDRLLKDPIAKGMRRSNYTKSLGEGKHWEVKPESDWIFNDVIPIVSSELWDKVNAEMLLQSKSRKKPNRLNTHLFGGIAKCHCGGKMYVPSNSPKYVCQTCRNKIAKEDLHELYHEALKQELTSEVTYKKATNDKQKIVNEKELQIQVLQKELNKLSKRVEQLFELNSAGQLDTVDFSNHYQPVKERKEQIEKEILKLQGEVDYLKVHTLDIQEVLDTAILLRDRWSSLSLEEKREGVRNCTRELIIGIKEIIIRLIPKDTTSFINDVKSSTKLHGFILATIMKLLG